MNIKYKFHILDGINTTVAEMTLSELVVFIKIFGDKLEIILTS